MAMLKWTVEFQVDETWVADGFDFTDERAKSALASELPYAYGHELRAKVISSPAAIKVAKLQGCSNASSVNKIRKDGLLDE